MPGTQILVTIDHPSLRAAVSTISREAVRRAGTIAKDRMRGNIIGDDLINSGRLLQSIEMMEENTNPVAPSVLIGTPLSYAKYPEYGTRAHGPVRAQALRFKPKGAHAYVFAKWVRGVRPYRFAQKTLDMVRPTDFV